MQNVAIELISSMRGWMRDSVIAIVGAGFMFSAIASLHYEELVSPAVERLTSATADATRGALRDVSFVFMRAR